MNNSIDSIKYVLFFTRIVYPLISWLVFGQQTVHDSHLTMAMFSGIFQNRCVVYTQFYSNRISTPNSAKDVHHGLPRHTPRDTT